MQIKNLDFLTTREKDILEKNRIKTIEELVYYFPYKYQDAPSTKLIQDLQNGEYVTISGIITSVDGKTGFYTGSRFTKATIADSTHSIDVIWWNMPFLAKSLKVNQPIILTGTVAVQKQKNKNSEPKLFLNSPKIIRNKNISINADHTLFQENKDESLTPVYSEFKNVKNFSIKKIIEKTLKSNQFKKFPNLIPEEISLKLHLGNRQNMIVRRHFPKDKSDLVTTSKYFAFEEIFIMQSYRAQEKHLRKDAHAYPIILSKNSDLELRKILPFKLTTGQENVLSTIFADLQKNRPMSRLVEGDVGSGKTILALAATYATINTFTKNHRPLQVAYIAPTEILANQHFETFIKILSVENVTIALLTRSGAKIYPSKIDRESYTSAPKSRVKKLLDEGKINIVIGTHALFNKNILFENLGLVIIDEQHRFGVKQRMNLIEKHKTRLDSKKIIKAKNDLSDNDDIERELEIYPIPHLLSMSATPIPRTLALTIYGDLDLSVLDELPPGRKRATTTVAKSQARNNIYKEMFEYLGRGKQAYIIAPRVYKENDELESASSLPLGEGQGGGSKKSSVEFEEKRIRKILSENKLSYKVGILHGKMNKTEKEEVIEKFYKNEIQILISTTVVEVGVSVANATFMIIENADTFGLAQLHQLRGRIERSSDISKCYLLTESEDENSLRRLTALEKSSNGFELAEIDLTERGPGSLIGNRQSGLSDIGMEAIKNRKLVEIAKQEAENIIYSDPTLSKQEHFALKTKLESFELHEE